MKKLVKILSQSLALFLTFALILPNPSFAFRIENGGQSEKTQGLLRTGLEEGVSVYLNPTYKGGGVAKTAVPFRENVQSLDALWKLFQIRSAGEVGLKGIPVVDVKGVMVFDVGPQRFLTNRPYTDRSANERLFVIVTPDRNGNQPKIEKAYNRARELVYPLPSETPGMNQIQVYLNADIQGGGIIGTPKVDQTTRFVGATFWGDPNIQRATRVILKGVPVFEAEDGKAAFKIGAGHVYVTNRPYASMEGQTVLVWAQPNSELSSNPVVRGAYNKAREKVYPAVESEEGIEVYLNPKVQNGKLMGSPAVHQVTRFTGATLWGDPQIQAATSVVLKGVPVTNANGVAAFKVGAGYTYVTDQPYEASQGRLLVVVTPNAIKPSAPTVNHVFMESGQEIYPASRTFVHINPIISRGAIQESDSALFYDSIQLGSNPFWSRMEKAGARRAALIGIPVIQAVDGSAGFQVGKGVYSMKTPYTEWEGDSLLVLMNVKRQTPTAAYRISDGKLVFTASAGLEESLDNLRDVIKQLRPLVQEGRAITIQVDQAMFADPIQAREHLNAMAREFYGADRPVPVVHVELANFSSDSISVPEITPDRLVVSIVDIQNQAKAQGKRGAVVVKVAHPLQNDQIPALIHPMVVALTTATIPAGQTLPVDSTTIRSLLTYFHLVGTDISAEDLAQQLTSGRLLMDLTRPAYQLLLGMPFQQGMAEVRRLIELA